MTRRGDRWLRLLETTARDLDDLDNVRELGEWFTGGSCRALGVVVSHGGSLYQIVLTAGDGARYPEPTDTAVAVGVYGDSDEDYERGVWACAVDVERDAAADVIRYLVSLVHETMPLELVLERDRWTTALAAMRADA